MKELGDEERLGRIETIGRRLNEAYCDEVGVERAAIGQPAVTQTPMEFRSDRVTLTAAELEEMKSVIQVQKIGDRGRMNQAEKVI